MQIKRKKYQVAGNTKLPNLLTLTTPSKISNYNNQYNALNNTIPSPTLSNDNWQYKPEQKAKPVINASSFIPNSTAVQDNTKTIKSDYNAKPNNNIVSYFDYKGDVKSVDIPYQGTAVPSEPKTLYNTYFNTPSNTKGTGIIPFASNMINASDVVGAGMAAKEGIKYGIKKAGQYVDKKMLNYGKDTFTPTLSNLGDLGIGNKAQSQFDNFLNLRQSTPINRKSKLYTDLSLNSKEARQFYSNNGIEVSKYSDKDLTDLMYMAAIKDKNLSSPKVVWRGDANAESYPELKTLSKKGRESSLQSPSSANNILGNFFVGRKSSANRYVTQVERTGLPVRMGNTIYNFFDYLNQKGYSNADIRKYMKEYAEKNKLRLTPNFEFDYNNPLYLEGSEIRSGFLKYEKPYYQTQNEHFNNPNPYTKYPKKSKKDFSENYQDLERYLKDKGHDMLIIKKKRNWADITNDIEHSETNQYILPYDKRNNFKSSHPYPSTLEKIRLEGSRDWNNPNIYKALLPPLVGTGIGLSYQNQNNSYKKLGGKLMKKSYKYGGKFQFGAKSLNKIGADEFSSTSSRKPQSINSFTPKNTLSSDNAKVIKTTYKKTNKNVTSFIDGQGKVRTAVIPNQGTIAKAEPKTLYNTYFNNPITTHGIGMVPFMNNMINAADIVGVGKVATNIGEKAIQNRVNANLIKKYKLPSSNSEVISTNKSVLNNNPKKRILSFDEEQEINDRLWDMKKMELESPYDSPVTKSSINTARNQISGSRLNYNKDKPFPTGYSIPTKNSNLTTSSMTRHPNLKLLNDKSISSNMTPKEVANFIETLKNPSNSPSLPPIVAPRTPKNIIPNLPENRLYGGKFQFGSKSLNKTNNDELGFSPSVTPKSSEMITPKSQAAIDNTSTVVRNNTTQTRLSQPSTKVAVANEFIDDMSNLKNDFNYTYGNIEKADTYDKVKVSDEIGKEHNLPKDENGYYRKQYHTQPNKSDESLRSSAGVNSSDYIVDPTVGLVKTKNQDIIQIQPRTYQATVETLTMDNINMPSGQMGMSTYDPESKLPGKMQPGIKLIDKDTDIYGDERAYYKDDEKTMYIHDINDVPDELSHDLQFRPESGTDTKKLIKNEEDAVNNYMKEHNINDNIAARDSVAYDKPGTLEYNAHQEIEPVIDKKVSDRSNAILTQQSTNNIYNEYPSLQKISKKDVLYPSLTNNPKSVFKPEVKKLGGHINNNLKFKIGGMANKAQLNNNQTMSISYIIDKINKSGYKSLTPEEDKFYRNNYKNIVKVEDDGSYSTELPAVTIKNNPVKDAVYRGGKFPQLVADTAYTFASTPSAFVGETMNLLHGKMPNYKNITRYETQQFPSQQLGITNPYAAVVVNTMTDPLALYGVGKGIAQGGIKALQAYSTASNIGRNAARNAMLKGVVKDVVKTTGNHIIDSAKKTYLPTINKPLEVMDVGLNLSHNLPTSNPMPYVKPTINTGNKLASTDINRKLGGKINKQRIIKKSLNMSNKYEYGGRIGDETFNVGNLRKGNTSGDSLRTMLGSNKIRISTRQPKWALNNGPIRKQHNLGLQAKYAKLGGRLYQGGGDARVTNISNKQLPEFEPQHDNRYYDMYGPETHNPKYPYTPQYGESYREGQELKIDGKNRTIVKNGDQLGYVDDKGLFHRLNISQTWKDTPQGGNYTGRYEWDDEKPKQTKPTQKVPVKKPPVKKPEPRPAPQPIQKLPQKPGSISIGNPKDDGKPGQVPTLKIEKEAPFDGYQEDKTFWDKFKKYFPGFGGGRGGGSGAGGRWKNGGSIKRYQVAGKTQLNTIPIDTGYTAPAIPNTNYYAPAESTGLNIKTKPILKKSQPVINQGTITQGYNTYYPKTHRERVMANINTVDKGAKYAANAIHTTENTTAQGVNLAVNGEFDKNRILDPNLAKGVTYYTGIENTKFAKEHPEIVPAINGMLDVSNISPKGIVKGVVHAPTIGRALLHGAEHMAEKGIVHKVTDPIHGPATAHSYATKTKVNPYYDESKDYKQRYNQAYDEWKRYKDAQLHEYPKGKYYINYQLVTPQEYNNAKKYVGVKDYKQVMPK